MPIAEIPVSDLRTTGFWMNDADFLTVQIKPIFQIIEIKAQTAPRAMIPNPREVSLGINAGINATA